MPSAPPIAQQDLDHVLQHTAQLWPGLHGARLFITGGTGFVGKWLLETLAAANARFALGAEATVLTRDPERFRSAHPHLAAGVTLVPGDIRRFAFPGGAFTHVIHAATEMAPGAAPLDVYDSVVDGTRRVLDVARERGIANVLLLSSGAVYGRQPPELSHIPETYQGAPPLTEPRTGYGQGKRAAEWLAGAYSAQHGLACRIARIFAVTGPHLPLDGVYAVGNFVRDRLAGTPIQIGGDGTPMRSYLYAADMAIWLWTILAHGEPGRAYNLGSEHAISIEATARAIAATLPVHIAQIPTPGRLPDRYVPSTALARDTLALQQRISFDEGLRRMIAWHQG